MAFTYCTSCGEKIDMDNARCPHCGHAREGYSYGEERTLNRERNINEPRLQDRENPYGRQNGGYGQGGGYDQGNGSFGQNGGYGFNGQQGRPLYRTPGNMPKKRPISVGLLIFSIINIVFGMCAMTSLIFGILALANTVQAQNAASEEQEIAKKKTALILNVVGAVLLVLTVVSFSVVFTEALAQYIENGGVI